MSRGRLSALAAGALALVVLSGCNTAEPGTPSASGNDKGTSASATPKPGTSTQTTSANTDLDPCSLLPDSNAASMGLATPGKSRRVSGVPGCDWNASGQFGVTIGIDNKGLANAAGERVSFPKHKAVKAVDAGGYQGCGFALEVSDKASVIIVVSLSGGKPGAEACPRAEEVAKIVDSKLP